MSRKLEALPEQSRATVTDQQGTFAGGLCQLNVTFSGPAIAWPGDPANVARPDQCLLLTNARVRATGRASKRPGTARTMAVAAILPSAAKSGIHWPSQNQIVVACGGSGLYQGDSSAGLPTTYTSIAASTAAGTPGFAIFTDGTNETLYIADGTLQKYTGAARSAPAGTPAVTGLCVYNSRLWGWTGTSNALYYSNLSTAVGSIGGDSLGVGASSGGQINVTTFGQSNIIACFTLGASLMICHERGVSRLTGFGQSDITVLPQSVSPEVGIVGPQAFTSFGSVAYVSTVQGLWRLEEGAADLLGTPDFPDPTVYPVTVAYNTASANTVQCVYNYATNEVWVTVMPSGVPAYAGTYVYNTITGRWYGPWNGRFAAMNGYVSYRGYSNAGAGSGKFPRILILDTARYVLDTEQSTIKDDVSTLGVGTAYTLTIQPHRMFGTVQGFPAGNVAKSWSMVNVLASLTAGATAPTVSVASVYGGTSTATFTTPDATEHVYYNAAGGAGPYLDVTITDTGTTASQYVSVDVEGQLTGRR